MIKTYKKEAFTPELEHELEHIKTVVEAVAAFLNQKHKDRFARFGFEFESDVFVSEGGWFDKDASLTISIGVVDEGEISSLKSMDLWAVEKRWFTLRGILDFESKEELLADLDENIEMLYQSYVKAD